jgi:hypothetical protein
LFALVLEWSFEMNKEQREELRRLADQCIFVGRDEAGDGIKALLDALEAAEAENERLRKDAARYRWLRRSNSNDDLPYVARDCWTSWGKLVTRELRNSSADKAIDKAMGAK